MKIIDLIRRTFGFLSIFLNTQDFIGASGVPLIYHGEEYIRPYYGLECPSTRQMKIIDLIRRTFDFLFTKTIRPCQFIK